MIQEHKENIISIITDSPDHFVVGAVMNKVWSFIKRVWNFFRRVWRSYIPYLQSSLDMLRYQAVSNGCLAALLWVINDLTLGLIHSTGRVAVTSGDFKFLFTTWQGILLIFFALLSLSLYIAFDLSSKVLYASNLIKQQDNYMFSNLFNGLLYIVKFMNPYGILVMIYLALVAPIVGIGLSISLTKGLYIPTFISSVIKTTPLYNAIYIIAIIVFLIIGILYIFVLHGVIIDGLSVKQSLKQSRQMIKEHFRDFYRQNVAFFVLAFLLNAVMIMACFIIPFAIVLVHVSDQMTQRYFLIFLTMLTLEVAFIGNSYGTPFYIIKLTQLYHSYKNRESAIIPIREKKKHPVAVTLAVLGLALLIFLSMVINSQFDAIFPLETDVRVIAHRAGGNEAPENTVKGIETAIAAGAYGAEIDIQRTKDGYYIVNHDTTFERTAGNKGKPGDMTLEQIKRLSVSGEPIATFEEMLEASKGHLVLFVELKGNSADRKMVDDAVKTIREYGMEDECVLISLKYDLIDYSEKTYPDIQTAFLTFITFGETAKLNCDFIGLEEESATSSIIESIHLQDKKVLVWTPNEWQAQKHFLLSDADAIITDNVYQANDIIMELSERGDVERFFDAIFVSSDLNRAN